MRHLRYSKAVAVIKPRTTEKIVVGVGLTTVGAACITLVAAIAYSLFTGAGFAHELFRGLDSTMTQQRSMYALVAFLFMGANALRLGLSVLLKKDESEAYHKAREARLRAG